MAYQIEEESEYGQNQFWHHAGKYTQKNADDPFSSEMAYMLVTLYRSEVK